MGLLERMDRRNQRILEYHNAMGKGPARRMTPRRLVVAVVLYVVARIVSDIAFDRWGAWAVTGVAAVVVVAMVVGGVAGRRKRLAWEAGQRAANRPSPLPVTDRPDARR